MYVDLKVSMEAHNIWSSYSDRAPFHRSLRFSFCALAMATFFNPQLPSRTKCTAGSVRIPSYAGLLFIRSGSSVMSSSTNKISLKSSSTLCRIIRTVNIPLVRSRYGVEGNTYKININEYMLTLDKPIGIRFAHTIDGQFFVEALAKKVRRKFKPFQNIIHLCLIRGAKIASQSFDTSFSHIILCRRHFWSFTIEFHL